MKCFSYIYFRFVQGDFVGYQSPGPIARALVLALSVCYHARLQDRSEYEEGVAKHFKGPIQLTRGSQQFRDEIRWCGAYEYMQNM